MEEWGKIGIEVGAPAYRKPFGIQARSHRSIFYRAGCREATQTQKNIFRLQEEILLDFFVLSCNLVKL